MSQLTKPSKGVKRSVADPSHSYHSLTPLWKKARAILQGQSNVKAHDELLEAEYKNILLPFSPSMTQAQYDFYRSEAELPGLTTQYAKTLINALLRKKSSLVLPEGLPEDAKEWIENNFTLDGKSLFNFLDAALWEELQTSHCWVYVDRPKVSDEEFDAMSQEERMMIAPYPVIIKAENVINVQTSIHPITRIKSLTRLVTRYMTEEYNPGNPWHPDYIDTVADHHLDSTGQLVIDYYRREGGGNYNEIKILNGTVKQDYKEELAAGAFTKFDTATPTMFGQRLTRIPAWPLNGHHDPIEPMLIPLVDREISLYNKLSRRNHLLYGAATYTPIVKSDMTDEEFGDLVNAGLGSWLKVRKDEDISVLETPTAALADMENSIANTVNEMAKMGIRMLSPEASSSGIALEIRNAAQTAQLGTLNVKVSTVMRDVITFMLNWKYGTMIENKDVDFTMSSDFAPVVAGENSMRLVSEWYQGGIISRSTFLRIAKYNDFLPADYDDESAIEEIQTDPLAQQTAADPELDIEE